MGLPNDNSMGGKRSALLLGARTAILKKQRASKGWGKIVGEVKKVLGEAMVVNDGDISTLRVRMRQLDDMHSALARSDMPCILRWSLQAQLAEKQRDLVPRPLDDGPPRTLRLVSFGKRVPAVIRSFFLNKAVHLLGRSICSVMPDVELDILGRMVVEERQPSSPYEEMVTAIMRELELPISFEDAVMVRLEGMSLNRCCSSDADKLKALSEQVERVLGEGETIVNVNEGEGGDCFSTLLERMRQLDNVDWALARSQMPQRELLQAKLAEKKKSLVPLPPPHSLDGTIGVGGSRTMQHSAVGKVVPIGVRLMFRDRVMQLVGPSIYRLMPALEMDILARTMGLKPRPSIESSNYEEMVTAIMNKLELPPTYEDLALQSFQRMSLT